TDDWGICDWCDQCHRKKGLTVWVDAFEPAGGVTGGEALVAAILGKIDAIEMSARPRKLPLLPWVYQLWDAGVLVPLAGASGKDSNREVIGAVRTYVQGPTPPVPLPEGKGEEEAVVSSSPLPFRERGPGGVGLPSWVEAIRTGRTFVSAGP